MEIAQGNMQQGKRTPAQSFKTLVVIHFGLVMGQVFFAAVAYFLNSSGQAEHSGNHVPFLYILIPLALGGILAGNFLFKKQLENITSNDILTKLTRYQVGLIIRMALIEAPCLFAIVGHLLTGDNILLICAMALIVYSIVIRPTKDKLSTELNLNYGDLS